jgi:hypothetical protein
METIWSISAYWNSFWGQFTIELLGGIIGSFIFLFMVLIFLKPKVRVAKFLCKLGTSSGNPLYIFKFVNLSFFSAHEVNIELLRIRRIPMGNGDINHEYEKLNLKNSFISHLPSRPTFWQRDKSNLHCIVVRSNDDLNAILKDEMQGVIIKVSLKHGLTGLSNVFEYEYGNEADIKTGKFKPGTKFGVI